MYKFYLPLADNPFAGAAVECTVGTTIHNSHNNDIVRRAPINIKGAILFCFQ